MNGGHRIKPMNHSNLIFVEQRFYSNGHVFSRGEKFSIIERIEKDTDIKLINDKKRRQIDKKKKS